MPYIIAFANQKGGVGKTTSAVNTAASLAVLGKRVLLCDLDPQGNATSAVGINKRDVTASVYDVLLGSVSPEKAIVKTSYENLWAMPSTISLAGAEFDLIEINHRENALKNGTDKISDDFDIIIIDVPRRLVCITVNALTCCRRCNNPDAVRIFCTGRTDSAYVYNPKSQTALQPVACHHGNTDYNV